MERFIVFTDKAHMPQTTLESERGPLMKTGSPKGSATSSGRCSTKTPRRELLSTPGTTGDPKGVLYSHRSNVLHSMMANNGDALGCHA